MTETKAITLFILRYLGITEINLKIASRSLPYSSSLKFDYNNHSYLQAYNTLFKNIREAPNDISYEDFNKSYTIYAFDLTPDFCTEEHYSILKDESLDQDVTCSSFKESYTSIFYLEFDNVIQITKERQVIYDYKIKYKYECNFLFFYNF